MKIGNKLFWLCQIVTFLIMGLFVWDFLTHGTNPVENNAVVVYLALLTAYAADKEVGRWAAKRDPKQAPSDRKGSWFVVLWVFFYFAAYFAHLFNMEWRVPEGLAKVVVSVLGVFFGTGVSKRLFGMLRPEGSGWGTPDLPTREIQLAGPVGVQAQRDQKIKADLLALLKANKEGLSVSEIEAAIGLNKRTVLRHLDDLEATRTVRMKGDGRSCRYLA